MHPIKFEEKLLCVDNHLYIDHYVVYVTNIINTNNHTYYYLRFEPQEVSLLIEP